MFATAFVDPSHVIEVLADCNFTYPRKGECDDYRGWTKFRAIPGLFKYFVEKGRFPDCWEGLEYLLQNCDSPEQIQDPMIVRRGQKLYLDFAREMHTLGLLIVSRLFAQVVYKAVLDISNIDFLVAMDGEKYGIQCAMRWNWARNHWTPVKEVRRRYRREPTWEGPVFLMSNRNIPHWIGPAECWFFREEHVQEVHSIMLAYKRTG